MRRSEKRGVGLRWVEEPHVGYNPRTGETDPTIRRRIQRDFEMPIGDADDAYILAQLGEESSRSHGTGAKHGSSGDLTDL